MHACGHDMHVTWLAGATALLAAARDAWQRHACWRSSSRPRRPPQGAQAMIDDGLFERFPKPEVILGQHVMPGPAGDDQLPARHHAGRRRQPRGPAVRPRRARLDARVQRRPRRDGRRDRAAPADDRLARGRRHARPRSSPIGALQAGTKDNVIPDEALLKLNVRTFDEAVRTHVLDAIERIVNAEAAASGAPRPPEITTTEHYPLTVNDPDAHRARRGRAARPLRRRPRPRARDARLGQRGLRLLRHRVGRAVGVLVRRRHRPRRLPRGRAGRPRRRRTSPPTTTRASPRSSTRRSRPASRR